MLGGCRWQACCALLALAGLSCATTNEASKNRTFYDWSMGDGTRAFERPYPSMDWPRDSPSSYFIGVSVLEGAVRFSRPRSWRIRAASSRPYEPFIHYVSPNAYSFAIYQRRDPPGDDWGKVLGRYEEDVNSTGAKIAGQPPPDPQAKPANGDHPPLLGGIPMATHWGQGRAYTVERSVDAAKIPLQSHSREMVLRSSNRVVLVQIVYQEHNLSFVDRELLHALETMEVR